MNKFIAALKAYEKANSKQATIELIIEYLLTLCDEDGKITDINTSRVKSIMKNKGIKLC